MSEDSLKNKTVQEYIDETPYWSDGTKAPFAPMTTMQWRIWLLASLGKFFEGLVVFMTGVALPLIVRQFELDATGKGVVAAAPLLGILVGATVLGGLADHFGRKAMFITEMALFVLFLIFLSLSPSYFWLVICLFGMGAALGCDYPTAHMVISESIPTRLRGKLVLSAFGFQALGALVGTGVGYLILAGHPAEDAWRWMYASAIIPALICLVGRFFITDSAHWLMARGDVKSATHETLRLLKRIPPYPKQVSLAAVPVQAANESSGSNWKDFLQLFSPRHLRATILASVPWFLQDLGTYGIGIFTPTILASVIGAHSDNPANLSELIHHDMLAAKGAALIDVLLIVGILVAFFLADKIGRIRLQAWGFLGCAAGLLLASLSLSTSGTTQTVFLFAGFMLFSLMTNAGPNAMTYLIAGEVFPTHIRGKGAGFAASIGKVGAVLTAFLFPVLLHTIGTQLLLYILVGTSILGTVVTLRFRIETTGRNLEKL